MRLIVIAFLVVFFTSCTGIKVTNNWDKKVDFEEFKTYSFFPWDKHNDQVINDYDKQTILMAIKKEMDGRGYKQVEKNGELVISTFVIVEDKTSYQSYTNHYGGWAGYGGGWGYGGGVGYYGYGFSPGYNSTTIYSTDFQQGTLLIDIFRLSDKRLIWQGIGSGEVTDNMGKRDRRLPMTIGHIFRRYPVTSKKSNRSE